MIAAVGGRKSMNWLAHAFLSPPDIEMALGNLLADQVKGKQRAGMSEDFTRGVRLHQAIDVFTDSHPVVGRSKTRIVGDYGHANGILIDIFYDHLLAVGWERYSAEPLHAFTARLYSDVISHPIHLPRRSACWLRESPVKTGWVHMVGLKELKAVCAGCPGI